ncbi:MAG: hypothetical protein RLZZ387_5690 [Chloroflexota bacterium]|jgi:CheY-like chemotaxis protein
MKGAGASQDALVVDDEVEVASFVAEILRDEGYHVRVQHDGASALVEIVRRPPALLLLNVAMPVMIGDELLRYLRRNAFADLPVIIMTASLQPEKYRLYGATDVLPKPFDIDELVGVMEQYAPIPPHTPTRA